PRALVAELALEAQALADDLGVEGAREAAVARHQQQPDGLAGLALLQQGEPRHGPHRRLGDLARHLADRLRVGAHGRDPLLGAPQARRGHHLHRPGDLVDVPDRGDAILDFLLSGYAGTSSRSASSGSETSVLASPSSPSARCSRTRSDSPSSSGLPSSSKLGPKSSIACAIASPSAFSSSSESSPDSLIRCISSPLSEWSPESRRSRNSCTRSVRMRSR